MTQPAGTSLSGQHSIDADDLAAVADQMGRTPHGVLGIAARDQTGRPLVILTHPLRREHGRLHPFPTIYWLTCPHLRRDLSRLESQGVIGLLDDRLRDEKSLQDQLAADHEAYIADRWALLAQPERAAVKEHTLTDAFLNRGIGGLQERDKVKCLHLHFAHHLARANVIGRILHDEFGVRGSEEVHSIEDHECPGRSRPERPDAKPEEAAM